MDRELRILALLAELQQLSPADAKTAARLTVRNADGDFIGEALLSDKAVAALTDSTVSMNSYLENERATAVPGTDIDPDLEAEFEEYCIGLDTDLLMSMAAQDPNQAVAAFDEITADGEL
ncbi:hypothetical protein OH809_44945 (plasmid) [Streptomyces sp. NBC_00873]|uniref:hypothetical protein n=1 Tax=Streptomyces sp. NBC_00873 TaxID=2975852 RepID=UPI0037DCDBDB|nr:hypothetical protein OH809_44945 [Streptomyces sp. NBC_00873]